MRIQMPFFLFVLSAGASGWCVAADVVVQPSSGSGFVIKDAGGVNERLRVNENGQVWAPVLATGAQQSTPVCVGTGGALGPCAPGTGGTVGPAGPPGPVGPIGPAGPPGSGLTLPYSGTDASLISFMVKNTNPTIGTALKGDAPRGFGVYGTSAFGVGVRGDSAGGIIGAGVAGVGSGTSYGVTGDSVDGIGVIGTSASSVGVSGKSSNGDGVRGESAGAAGAGVRGIVTSSSGLGTPYGVFGSAINSGYGVYGIGVIGVHAESTSGSPGLEAFASKNIVGVAGNSANFLGNIYVDGYANLSGYVAAANYYTNSDVRIKDVKGISESTSDLATLNAIEVTDYTMKDKAVYGNRVFKKIIAQQVEVVYPQVVLKHPDFIPNVYQSSDKIEKVEHGYKLGFARAHHLSVGAKRVRLWVGESATMQVYPIVAIPSANEVTVDMPDPHADRIFVYGEEVDDFRTVDYDGLTTLNISATQELSKRFARQEDEIAASMRAKDAQIAELQRAVAQLQTNAADIAELRATLAALQAAQPARTVAVAVARP